MTATFALAQTNYNGYFDPTNCPVDRFKPWIRYLNKHCLASTAINEDTPPQIDPLKYLYFIMVNSTLTSSFRININNIWGRNITITNDGVHMILCFPCDNFEVMPTTTELTQFVE